LKWLIKFVFWRGGFFDVCGDETVRRRIETLTDLPGKQSVVAGAQAGPIAGGQIGLSR
jgi:hypothetical protein